MSFLTWHDGPWCIYTFHYNLSVRTYVQMIHVSGRKSVIGLDNFKKRHDMIMIMLMKQISNEYPATEAECAALAAAFTKIRNLPDDDGTINPAAHAKEAVERSFGSPAPAVPARS